jgi:exodeoxyribonuclease-3
MTKSSVPIGCKGQKQKTQAVNDPSHQLICDTSMKKDLKETIHGAEDSLNNSGKVNKRKSRKNVMEEQDVVKTSRVRRETIKRNDTSGNKNPNNMDDEKKVTRDEVCTEVVTNSNSEKRSKKRKTTVKSSEQVEVKSVIDVEVKESVDILGTKDEPWTLLVHKKLQSQWVAYNPTSMRKPVPSFNCLKILSWNVNGLRALLKVKGTNPIAKLAEKENFDVLCLQETKLQVSCAPLLFHVC